RVPNGTYRFEGREYQLPCNDKESHAAIHGFARTRSWESSVEPGDKPQRTEITFRFRTEENEVSGYPFGVQAAVTYRLGPAPLEAGEFAAGSEGPPVGMACHFQIHNHGTIAAPVGIGFHPYFCFDG